MSEPPGILIAAASGRAMASSARRAGYAPFVVDYFADQDTLECAERCVRIEGGLADGFQLEPLMAACERAVGARSIEGFVYGSGFEDRPELISAMAERWRLFGNRADVVARVKDPIAFSRLCADCDIPHPETRLEKPRDPRQWLARQRGGSGGGHIRAFADSPAVDAQTYFQRQVEGRPVSALVLGDGARCRVLGFSEQWSTFQNGRPFRFAGAARPAALSRSLEAQLASAIERVYAAVPLVGLNSFDFLASNRDYWLLEANPRPGATFDIFEPITTGPDTLLGQHVAACEGRLARAVGLDGACASQIVYADREIGCLPKLDWPDWARDRQVECSRLASGDPFCTVIAAGATLTEARGQLSERVAMIRSSIVAMVA